MDVIEQIKKVDQFFVNVWSPERHQLIQLLTRKKEEVHEQKRQHVSNSLACSKASFVSGVLKFLGFVAGPTTCGLSLLLTTAGTATGLASGFAGIANDYKHSDVVLKNWEKTLVSIGEHVKTCEAMVALLEQLQEISGYQIGILRVKLFPFFKSVKKVWSIYCNMCKLVNELKALHACILSMNPQTMAKFSKFSINDLFTVVGIVYDTYAIFSGQNELSNLNKGTMCSEAQKLHDLIANLQEETENLNKLVKDITSLCDSK